MGFFNKKTDPISDRAKALNAQIAALESQIKQLNGKVASNQPRVRSTTLPNGQSIPADKRRESVSGTPIFEKVGQPPIPTLETPEVTPEHYNDLGVRKYDLVAAWKRLQSHFREPPASNPKLVSYLAAGSIKGLRPLRYEKRVARNRFIALSVFFGLILWGILYALLSHR